LVHAGPLVQMFGTGFVDEPAGDEHRGRGSYDGQPGVAVALVGQLREYAAPLQTSAANDGGLSHAPEPTRIFRKADAGRLASGGCRILWRAPRSIRTPLCAHRPVRWRCLHPGQQQGRRMPSSSSSWVRRMRRLRVIACFASSTQQMNSLRAKGVMSLQAASAVEFALSASRGRWADRGPRRQARACRSREKRSAGPSGVK
jgi:hypothetical protein